MELTNSEYKTWLTALKLKISATQIKAAIAVNSALIVFYWELGKMISEKQTQWGTQFLKTLSKDLSEEFPEMKGFSVTNLNYCRVFYNYIPISPQVGGKLENEIRPQLGEELTVIKSPQLRDEFNLMKRLPWGHIKLLIDKNLDELKEKNIIRRVENDKTGHWEIIQ